MDVLQTRLQNIAPGLLAFVGYLVIYLLMRPITLPGANPVHWPMNGDEPHYLAIAYTLLHYHDVDLRHISRVDPSTGHWQYLDDVMLKYHGYPGLAVHARDWLGNGAIVSEHPIGLPVLLIPSLLLTDAVWGARLTMILLSALLAHQLFGLLRDIWPGDRRLRWYAWITFVFSIPLVLYSNQLYPEVPAALCLVIAARAAMRSMVSMKCAFGAGIALTYLPWLHPRYIVLAGGLLLVVGFHMLCRMRKSSALVSTVHTRWRLIAVCAAVAIPLLLSTALFALFSLKYYGHPLPGSGNIRALGVDTNAGIVGRLWTLETLYANGWGAWFSSPIGWIPYNLAAWLGIAGALLVVRVYRWPALLAVGAVVLYTIGIGTIGWSGASFPGRYLVALVPFVAVAFLVVVSRRRWAFYVSIPLTLYSLLVAAISIPNHIDLLPEASGRIRLPLIEHTTGLWPVIPRGGVQGFTLRAEEAARQTGRLATDEMGGVEVHQGEDQAGAVLFGPYTGVVPGRYIARYTLAGAAEPADVTIAHVDVMASDIGTSRPWHTILATRAIAATELQGDQWTTIELPFETQGAPQLQTRILWTGVGILRVQGAVVVRVPGNPYEDRFPGRVQSLAWWTATALMALALWLQPLGSTSAGGLRSLPCGPASH